VMRCTSCDVVCGFRDGFVPGCGSAGGVRSSGVRDVPVIDVENVYARLARRFGPEVAEWCADLPALAGELAGRWGLRLGQAWPAGGTSVVLPCESADGELLVLKLTPDLKIAADEATALDAWKTRHHVVTLHNAGLDRGALLLERVLPGSRLADEPGRWTLGEVAPVLSDLWRQPFWLGAGSGLPELRERADFVLPGCAIFAAIQTLWPAPEVMVADRGLREGLLLRLIRADRARSGVRPSAVRPAGRSPVARG